MESRTSAAIARDRNQQFYDSLWGQAQLIPPDRFNTWPHLKHLAGADCNRLEIGPGLRPRLPIADTHFVDLSQPALDALAAAGGHSYATSVESLPFADASFDTIVGLDVVEHTADGEATLAEIARVARVGATFWLSVPLHAENWRPFDDIVGHCQRYDGHRLASLLAERGFTVEASAVFGMKPRAPRLVDWAIQQLARHPRRAMWFYNRLFMPIGLRCQKPLYFHDGLIETAELDEILLCCRRS